VVGVNLHIEVGWKFTVALVEWSERLAIPFCLWIHDYWPHHKKSVRFLTVQHDACLLAATPAIRDALGADGFQAEIVPAGVPLPAGPEVSTVDPVSGSSKAIVVVGRLVPRKRFIDAVRAFSKARLDRKAAMHLILLPSLVYPAEHDEELIREIRAEAVQGGTSRGSIRIVREPLVPFDFSSYAVSVRPSDYEGLSMTPIESAYAGCPPLLSDIPPHRAIVEALFVMKPGDFLHPVGDHEALAVLLTDEIGTGRRRAELAARLPEVRETIESRWSLERAAGTFARLTQEGHERMMP
jgi:glycosyltransferase involved in cell wall biosynthesis